MKFYTTTLAATSALCLSMGMAYADSNTLYLDQNGTGNVSDIDQSHTGQGAIGNGGNDIGTAANPGLQNGNNNTLTYSNAGYAHGGHNDIVNVEQNGNDNTMSFKDSNQAYNNVTNDAQQNGDNNLTRASHNGGDDNVLDILRTDGSRNDITVDQSGKNGFIGTVQIIGDDNGNNGSHVNKQNWGIRISQGGGSGNIIHNATITGDNNPGLAGYGYFDDSSSTALRGTALRIIQSGNANDANATMLGSNGNAILIHQYGGDSNIGDVNQGISQASTGNAVKLIQMGNTNNGTVLQSGSYNIAHATQSGDGNFIDVNQVADSNTLMASFTGDANGDNSGLSMSGVAGDLEGSSGSLTQGHVLQDSTSALLGNDITYDVTGNSNLFAFAQIGGDNSITGTVGSNSNQVAVLQTGTGNVTGFTQTGGDNNAIAVSQ
ncbi:hypothetical protein U5922_001890 [Aquicoccus sp. G2-2]|uniref:hypothetical protein n=1 Tax=Aquicoccus sp. G2-2 TaxID=3092120 RepID=UPI002AE026FC|nr:hypothetical protein [Aquicoccus sp. G2-2]MEA1112279.1 hypothetical protein [Aquicoccus sp. G2-2]